MGKLNPEISDWHSSEALSLADKSIHLEWVKTSLAEGSITPEEALYEASFAFNTLTDYGDNGFDNRIILATDIQRYKEGASTFKFIADFMKADAQISFRPLDELPIEDWPPHTTKLSDYIELLEHQLDLAIDDYLLLFPENGKPKNPGSASDLLAYLFEEQWQNNTAHDINAVLEIDRAQIASLCKMRSDIEKLSSDSPLPLEDRKRALDDIIAALKSKFQLSAKPDELPVTEAVKQILHARTIYELGVLSNDGNSADFKLDYNQSCIKAIKGLRKAEKYIDHAIKIQTDRNPLLESLRDENRYFHDLYSEKLELPTVGFSQQPLSALEDVNIPSDPQTPENQTSKVGALAIRA